MHYTLISLVGFIKTVAIIIAVYYLFKVVARVYMPAIIRATTKQVLKKMNPENQIKKEQEKKRKQEGKVTVNNNTHQTASHKSKHTSSQVEDVDFEELD